MKKFVVTYCEHELSGRADVMVVGTFSDYQQADNALIKAFKKACDTYCVDENLEDETQCDTLNSFFNEARGEFNIDYMRNGEVAGEVFGNITECEEDEICMDVEIEEDEFFR